MSARFFEQEVKARLTHRRRLSQFLDQLIQSRRPLRKISLNYIFCSDDALHNINLQFLQHDTLTDIITFDLSDRNDELQAEIYISIDRVAENAEQFNTSYERELHRVIFHGALHLCGLRDKKPAEQKAMRQAEDAALEAWFA
ncbi:MAG: rRNA maturation RNase YbeY [Bacteroidetes bacterium]|nr:rRNA maturation RNase YbeY [Bacteroidota bacterium]MBS1629681.1 rRNA maturation RNase YbeY [Bacteroidota bacterium]